MPRIRNTLILCLLIAGCSQQPVVSDEMTRYEGEMPDDFSGSWQRNYARDEDINAALSDAYNRLFRSIPDRPFPRAPGLSAPSSKDTDAILALARLAELITRPDVLTISQDEYEIRVDRKDDFSMLCAFYDGVAKGTESPYGREICGWDGKQLVSNLTLPGGLQVTHRFTKSTDGQQLRVVTTLESSTSAVPVTLRRFYTRFRRPAPALNCVETLSMKRVCSTGEISL